MLRTMPRRLGERGATLVEFTVSIGLFLLALFFFIDMVVVGFRLVSAQYLAARAVRSAVVTQGNIPNGNVLATCVSRLNQIRNNTVTLARRFGLSQTTAADIYVCPATGGNCQANNVGAAKGFIQLEVEVPLTIMAFKLNFRLRARAVSRNEAFVGCT